MFRNVSFLLTAVVTFTANCTGVSAIERNEQLLQGFLARHLDEPRDKTKTPTTPDIIEHQPNIKGPDRRFERKRIYFGKDQNNKPCYLPIWQHAQNNPDFANVRLFILENPKFKSPRANHYNFTYLGTYAEKDQLPQLRKSISRAGGLWCPEQKAFLGGTRDGSLCEKLEMFELYAQQAKNKFTK